MFIDASESCFKLFVQVFRRAASRAACTAGSSSATSVPIIAITTKSSTSVKPRDLCLIQSPSLFDVSEGLLPSASVHVPTGMMDVGNKNDKSGANADRDARLESAHI